MNYEGIDCAQGDVEQQYSITSQFHLRTMHNYHSSPAWTMPKRSPHAKQDPKPAPTSYFANTALNPNSPTWKIGTSSRGKLSLMEPCNPGPGSYNPDKTHNTSFKFTQAHRTKQMCNQVPGPGTYQIKDTGKKLKRGYYMAQKYDIADTEKENPGPGAYEKSFASTLAKGFGIIGREKRLVYKESEVPGPGRYQQRCKSAGGISFSKEKRMQHQVLYNNIGPGKYEPCTSDFKSNNKGYSISTKPQEHQTDATPGPSSYHPKEVYKMNKSSIIIAQKYSQHQRPKTPGPGEYSYEDRTSFITEIKHGVFGKDNRKPLLESSQSPGPGSYTISSKPSAPKYSLAVGRKMTEDNAIPGPGEYTPNYRTVKIRPFSAKIGTSTRKQFRREVSPGPGQYTHCGKQRNPEWRFSTSDKLKQDFSSSPAPNHYQMRSTLSDVPSYILPTAPH